MPRVSNLNSKWEVGAWAWSWCCRISIDLCHFSLLKSRDICCSAVLWICLVLFLVLTFLQCETPFQMPLASNWRGWGLSSPPREPRLCLSNRNKQTHKQISFGLWTNQRLWEEKAKSQSIGSAPVQWPNFERNDFVTLLNDNRQCFHVVRTSY